MSCTVTLYALSLEHLRRVIGGGSLHVVEAIRAEENAARRSSSRLALAEDLVRRGPAVVGCAAADEIGFALELVCRAIGRSLPSAELRETSAFFLEVLAGTWPWAASLLRPRIPVPLPTATDFPVIGHLTRAEMDDVACDDAALDQVEADIGAGAVALLEAMDAAREGGNDLIAFTS